MGESPTAPDVVIRKFPCIESIRRLMDKVIREVKRGSQLDCSVGTIHREMKEIYLKITHDCIPGNCLETKCSLRNSDEWADEITGGRIPRVIPGCGNADADIMFVAEGPGTGERCSYIPLVGPEQLINSMCAQCSRMPECMKTILPEE